MRSWTSMLGGLIVWAAHFFALYAIASIFLTTPTARVLALLATAACFAADGWLLRRDLRRLRGETDEPSRWMTLIALLSSAISLVAVLWQGFPAVLA